MNTVLPLLYYRDIESSVSVIIVYKKTPFIVLYYISIYRIDIESEPNIEYVKRINHH